MTVQLTFWMLCLCVTNSILPAIKQTWEVGIDGTSRIHHVATERGNAIVDGHGKPLAYLADSEIVNGSVISKDKKVLVLKLDYKKFSNGGVIVQYYSRLLWFHTEPHGSIARSLLSYDKDFLMKQRMSVHQLLSVADDGWSIVASLKVATNDQSHDVIRTINPFKPSFIEAPKGKMNPNK